MSEKRKIVWSFIIGFVLGGAVLCTGFHIYGHFCRGPIFAMQHRQPHRPEFFLKKLSRELDLTADQKTQIEKILEANIPKMEELKKSLQPQFETIRQKLHSEIRAVLKPEQQAKFDQLLQKLENRRKKWEEKMDRARQ